jgi:hypothetical protein
MRNTERVRTSGEMRALRDEEWLRLHEAGKATAELAVESGVSVQLLRRAISRARKARESRTQEMGDGSIALNEDVGLDSATAAPRTPWWLELVPLFPIGPFTPSSECPHRGPIREGSLLCCMVCSASGIDGHPALVRDPDTDPRPEPKTRRTRQASATQAQAVPTEDEAQPETRRQRRTRIFGMNSASEVADQVDRSSR